MTSVSRSIASSSEAQAKSLPPQERYLFKPLPGSSHHWAYGHLDALTSQDSVLDVGAGSGAFGKLLGEKGLSSVDAIEIDNAALEHIRPLYRRAVTSLSEVPDGEYNVALLLDVLEHLAEPKPFFETVLRKVKPGGMILVSVPNIAHWSIRLLLLLGQFTYTERGILDRTHLHFFTRKSFREFFLSSSGVQIDELGGSISPAEFVLPQSFVNSQAFTLFSRARTEGVRLLPGLCAYQLLAKVRRT